MPYSEFAPPPCLADSVRCLWTFEDDAHVTSGAPERIVPDGRPELIVHFGAPFIEDSRVQAAAVFAGQITRPLWLRASGPAGVVGVRFHPAGARRFLGLALHEATDTRIPLADLWPGEARVLVDAISTACDARSRATIAADFVVRRIQRHALRDDALVEHCTRWIEARAGQFAIDDLVGEAGVGRRQLERRFRDAAGIPPRLLGNILRFRSVFDALEQSGSARWTDAAMAAGYFDQSHLIRDCRRFLGCTPTEFLESRGDLATALVDG
jgi:methylphosphotriester-DNA--protein-cysteine methyltransferase